MKLTRGVEQAICIIILLATQEKNVPLSTDEISKKLDVSPSYFKKIVRKLVVANIITSVPGNNGGISLAKSPEQINTLEVIEAMEGPISIFPDTGLISQAFKGGLYVESGTEILRQTFSQADLLLKEYFSKITTADLLKENFGPSVPTLNWNEIQLSDYVKNNRGDK